jgi:translation initiation factor 2 subunit 2
MDVAYDGLLQRLRAGLTSVGVKPGAQRLELPEPKVMWIGNKTIFRNFAEYPSLLRRDPNRFLMFLAKELATAASLDGDRAIFIGRKDPQSFGVLINRFLKEFVTCPVCGSPDTHAVREKRLNFLVCEACGAKSSVRAPS